MLYQGSSGLIKIITSKGSLNYLLPPRQKPKPTAPTIQVRLEKFTNLLETFRNLFKKLKTRNDVYTCTCTSLPQYRAQCMTISCIPKSYRNILSNLIKLEAMVASIQRISSVPNTVSYIRAHF